MIQLFGALSSPLLGWVEGLPRRESLCRITVRWILTSKCALLPSQLTRSLPAGLGLLQEALTTGRRLGKSTLLGTLLVRETRTPELISFEKASTKYVYKNYLRHVTYTGDVCPDNAEITSALIKMTHSFNVKYGCEGGCASNNLFPYAIKLIIIILIHSPHANGVTAALNHGICGPEGWQRCWRWRSNNGMWKAFPLGRMVIMTWINVWWAVNDTVFHPLVP